MKASEHARRMLVKRNHPDHTSAVDTPITAEKPCVEPTEVQEAPVVTEPVVEVEVLKPKKSASKKKVEVAEDD